MTAPKVIWVNTDNREDGCCPVEDTQYGNGRFYDHESATRYIRADAPELLALVWAVRAEIEARNLFLATAPDRGGNYGPKGQRRIALEAAQSATVQALAAWEAIAPKPTTDALTPWGIQPDGLALDAAKLPIHLGGKASDDA